MKARLAGSRYMRSTRARDKTVQMPPRQFPNRVVSPSIHALLGKSRALKWLTVMLAVLTAVLAILTWRLAFLPGP